MKKLLLVLAISASAVMADVGGKDDLLNIATAGKTTGSSYEMKKEDMQKAEGGYFNYYSYMAPYNSYNRFSSYNSYYSNPSSSSYAGTSRSYIYANAFRVNN